MKNKIIKFIKRVFYRLCVVEAQSNQKYYGELIVRFFKFKLSLNK